MLDSVQNLVNEFVSLKGNAEDMVLPVLHHIQDSLGYIPKDSANIVAKKFNLSRAEIHGVITYYHHFRTNKPAKYNIQLCGRIQIVDLMLCINKLKTRLV